VSPTFTEFWLNKIQGQIDKNKKLSNLYKIVKLFCNNQRLTNAKKDSTSQEVFPATYQEKLLKEGEDSKSKDNKLKKPSKPYLCKLKHWFFKCYYLVKSIQPKDWKPNPKKQKEIEEKIKSNLQIKAAVEKAQKKAQKKNEKNKNRDSNIQTSEVENTPATAPAYKKQNIGGFVIHVFTAIKTSNYHLQHSFILDNRANKHITNTPSRVYNL
jgi:hypothetical protein